MENITTGNNKNSSPTSTNASPQRYSFASLSAQQIRENRNNIIQILDTLKTLSQIRSRNIAREEGRSCCNCSSSKQRDLDMQKLVALHKLKTSRSEKQVQPHPIGKEQSIESRKRKLNAKANDSESD